MSWYGTKAAGKRNARARHSKDRRTRFANAKSYGAVDRMDVYDRCNGLCDICKLPVPVESFEVEHRVALANGGDDTWRNLFIAHPRCNASKGARPKKEKRSKTMGGLARTAPLKRKTPLRRRRRELDPEAF